MVETDYDGDMLWNIRLAKDKPISKNFLDKWTQACNELAARQRLQQALGLLSPMASGWQYLPSALGGAMSYELQQAINREFFQQRQAYGDRAALDYACG